MEYGWAWGAIFRGLHGPKGQFVLFLVDLRAKKPSKPNTDALVTPWSLKITT
jgi:hypothetical protein